MSITVSSAFYLLQNVIAGLWEHCIILTFVQIYSQEYRWLQSKNTQKFEGIENVPDETSLIQLETIPCPSKNV